MRHETAVSEQKQSRNSSYHFCLFSSPSTTEDLKICWKPYFIITISVLASQTNNFQNLNIKHRKLKNPVFAPFFEKGYFQKFAKSFGTKKTQNENWGPVLGKFSVFPEI